MDEIPMLKLMELYGLNPDIPHLALQFPRLPPSLSSTQSELFRNLAKEKFISENNRIKKIEVFQNFFLSNASKLVNNNSSGIIPPGHPLFSDIKSMNLLKLEKEKLLKENQELRKKLDKKPHSTNNS